MSSDQFYNAIYLLMYIIVQYYTFCLINLFLGLSSHCAYDLLERRLHNLNEKDYSEVQTLVQVTD